MKNNILIWGIVIILIVWILVINIKLLKLESQCGEIWDVDLKLFKENCQIREAIIRKLGALYGSDYDEWAREQADKENE